MPDPSDDTGTQHGWGWLEPAGSATIHTLTANGGEHSRQQTADPWQWVTPTVPPPSSGRSHPHIPRRVWIGLAAGFTAAATLVTLGLQSVNRHDEHTVGAPTEIASPPTSSPSPQGSATPAYGRACEGLSASTVTAADGDRTTMDGAIAAFEYAYYVRRDAPAAMAMVAPEAGLQVEALAAGIATIPIGTTHCVAITPIAATTAEVHLAELRRDGHRTDYLQVINIRFDGDHALITNIQKRG